MSGEDGADSSAEAFAQDVIERLRARRAEMEAVIFARVHDLASGAVGLADPEYMAGLRAAITSAVEFVLDGLERDGKSVSPTPSAVMVQARRAARVGVGLGTVLRRYVAGLAVLEDFVMQEANHSVWDGERTTLRDVLEASASLFDRLLPPVIDAYTQKLEPAERTPGPTQIAPGLQTGKQGSRGVESKKTRGEVAQDQRERILRAVVQTLAERGFAGATIGLVVAQARVSTRTFYELFDGVEQCLIEVMDGVLEEVVALASQELQEAERWQDGLRSSLAAVLAFFDRNPALARVTIVETLAGGPGVLAHRERLIEAFRLPVLRRVEREVRGVSPVAAEGMMSSVLGIMHAHMVMQRPGPFTELLGPLMGLIMAPHVGGWGVQREIEQGEELARAILNGDSRWSQPVASQWDGSDKTPTVTLFPNLGDATARRLRACLRFLADHPNSSNRGVSVGIDLIHQSQVSKLLAHLLQEGLATKRSEGRGKHNAWRLTPHGAEVARAITHHEP